MEDDGRSDEVNWGHSSTHLAAAAAHCQLRLPYQPASQPASPPYSPQRQCASSWLLTRLLHIRPSPPSSPAALLLVGLHAYFFCLGTMSLTGFCVMYTHRPPWRCRRRSGFGTCVTRRERTTSRCTPLQCTCDVRACQRASVPACHGASVPEWQRASVPACQRTTVLWANVQLCLGAYREVASCCVCRTTLCDLQRRRPVARAMSHPLSLWSFVRSVHTYIPVHAWMF